MSAFAQQLTEAARAAGLLAAGCLPTTDARLVRALAESRRHLSEWVKSGAHGEMRYLERRTKEDALDEKRWSFARSVIIGIFEGDWRKPCNGTSPPFPPPTPGQPTARISAYARGIDYHRRGAAMLERLAELQALPGRWEISVDTGPVCERTIAVAAGLGVRGRNGLLRVPGPHGTSVFIGLLFTEAGLPPVRGNPQPDPPCEVCGRCLRRCPTGALQEGRPLEARRCISYLTIEKRGVLSREEAVLLGDRLFGCDECTACCPPSRSDAVQGIPIDLEWLLKASAGEVRRAIEGTALAYAGVTRLRRTAVALLKAGGVPDGDKLLEWVRRNTGSELIRKQLEAW